MTGPEFELLFREQFNLLCNLACTVVKDADVSKDVVQQVFLNYWQRRDTIEIRGSVKGYFYKAVLNNAITHLNKTRRLTPIETIPVNKFIEEPAKEDNSQIREYLHKAISDLPPVCQEVFRLSRFSDLTNKEIAEEMNISLKAVEKHITKALKFLRERLKPLRANNYLITIPLLLMLYFWVNGVGYFTTTLSL
jgi:RNA polymerase sigma-70 factor (ECF subfamily)